MVKIYFASGSLLLAQCSLERFVVFAAAIVRTARNCYYLKPNNKKMRANSQG